jgi:hypothetical protein
MNEYRLTYVVRGVRPEREDRVRAALAKFIESEGLYEEAGDDPWEVERAGPGALMVDSMSPVRMRAAGYQEATEEALTKILGAENGGPCEVKVTVVDAQDLDEVGDLDRDGD